MRHLGLLIASCLLSLQPVYALQLTSDENGSATLSEPQLKVGEMAPEAILTTPNFKQKQIGGGMGKVQIISTIESYNTSVCDLQTMQLSDAAKKLKHVEISVVTANMPFVVDDFQKKHKIDNINLLSSFNNKDFGKKYGLLVVKGDLTGILARSVFVIDKSGKVVYKEIPHNIDHMPNLDAAIKAAEKAVQAKCSHCV